MLLERSSGHEIMQKNHRNTSIECYLNANWICLKINRRVNSGYLVLMGWNIIMGSKNKNAVSRLSVKLEYSRVMSQFVWEIMWLSQPLIEVGLKSCIPAKLRCDDQVVLHIASNIISHERTKHIESDYHFVWENIQEGLISIEHVRTRETFLPKV